MAIRSCGDKHTSAFLNGKRVRAFEECAKAAEEAIAILQNVERLIELREPPSNHFKAFHGNREGEYEIRITGKWRLAFRWEFSEPIEGRDVLMGSGRAL
jgi:plasmid maintenance system killer protein